MIKSDILILASISPYYTSNIKERDNIHIYIRENKEESFGLMRLS